jgi:Rps23 Pro-64 3,4-dihydroxylase Tpa1-like proline 4-hydroxylase
MVFGWGKKKEYSRGPLPNVQGWLIDFEKLFSLLPEISSPYRSASPFPHVVLSDFVSKDCIGRILEEFSLAGESAKWHEHEAFSEGGEAATLKKKDSADFLQLGPTTRQLIWELNSRPFIQFLQRMTGIPRIISDPLAYGGGVHETIQGGLLKVHADFQKHPIYLLDRRLNLIVYLNHEWQESYGGELELWDESLTSCEQRILPEAGRCVIFNTNATSYHGHPHPLTCPANRTRKSIALYYYTNGLNDEPRFPEGKTNWKDIPNPQS